MSAGPGDRRAQAIEMLLDVITGAPGGNERFRNRTRAELEAKLLGPARRYRQDHDGIYQFGPKAQAYLDHVIRLPFTAEALILALVEELVDRPEPDPAADMDRPAAQPSGLDWDVLRAERDTLARKLAKAERERDALARDVSRKAETIAALEQKNARLDAELIETNGRLADAGEALLATADAQEES
jgi:hypothetical protein